MCIRDPHDALMDLFLVKSNIGPLNITSLNHASQEISGVSHTTILGRICELNFEAQIYYRKKRQHQAYGSRVGVYSWRLCRSRWEMWLTLTRWIGYIKFRSQEIAAGYNRESSKEKFFNFHLWPHVLATWNERTKDDFFSVSLASLQCCCSVYSVARMTASLSSVNYSAVNKISYYVVWHGFIENTKLHLVSLLCIWK